MNTTEVDNIKKEASALTASVTSWTRLIAVGIVIVGVGYIVTFIGATFWDKASLVETSLAPIAFLLVLIYVILSSIRGEITSEYLARELAAARRGTAPAQQAVSPQPEVPAQVAQAQVAQAQVAQVAQEKPEQDKQTETITEDTRQMPVIPASEKTSPFFSTKPGSTAAGK